MKSSDRHAGKLPKVHQLEDPAEGSSENSPLLGFEAPDIEDENGINETQSRWEGYKDFEGLPWWRRPSVSSVPCS